MGSLYKPRDIQSPCITRTEAKPVTEVETETPHTKESETIILIKAVIWTLLLESRLHISAQHQRHIWKIKAQVSSLKIYFDYNCPV